MTAPLTRNLALAAAAAAFAGGAHAANVVHYWDFEGGVYTDSVGGAGGTAGNDVSMGAGHIGSSTAAVFPRSGDSGTADFDADGYVDVDAVNPSGDVAFSFWFNTTDDNLNTGRGIADFSGDGNDGPQFLLNSGGSLIARIDGSGTSNVVATAAGDFIDGTWHFAAINYNATTGQLDIHVDGAGVDGSATSVIGAAAWSATQYLGAFNVGGTGNTVDKGLGGSLDDFAIYSGTLTDAEINGLFAGTIAPTDIPEPGSLALLGLGGLAMLRRRRA